MVIGTEKTSILARESLLQAVKNSVGSRLFRNVYILSGQRKIDILKNGELSCAYFVSSILKLFDLIAAPHATVKGTLADMLKSGWRPTKKLSPGNVLLWEQKIYFDGPHSHLGFFIGKDKAVSNSRKKRMPVIHHLTFGRCSDGEPKRKILKIFVHPMADVRRR